MKKVHSLRLAAALAAALALVPMSARGQMGDTPLPFQLLLIFLCLLPFFLIIFFPAYLLFSIGLGIISFRRRFEHRAAAWAVIVSVVSLVIFCVLFIFFGLMADAAALGGLLLFSAAACIVIFFLTIRRNLQTFKEGVARLKEKASTSQLPRFIKWRIQNFGRLGCLAIGALLLLLLGFNTWWKYLSPPEDVKKLHQLIWRVENPDLISSRIPRHDRMIRNPSDVAALVYPPRPPANKKELKILKDRIVRFDFPECNIEGMNRYARNRDPDSATTPQACLSRLDYEADRIKQIRDPGLVPVMIRIAKKKTYSYGPLMDRAGQGDDKMRFRLHQRICRMRFNAISALGDMGDPRSVDPLLGLLREPVPDFSRHYLSNLALDQVINFTYVRDFFPPSAGFDEGSALPAGDHLSFTCTEALQALTKMKVPVERMGLRPEVLQALNRAPRGQGDNLDQSVYIAARAGCAASLPDKLSRRGYRSVWEANMKRALHGTDRDKADFGEQALGLMAAPELIPEYTWAVENRSSAYWSCRALGIIKDPATAPFLINVLKANTGKGELEDKLKIEAIVQGLGDMGLSAREAVPTLVEALDNCDSAECDYIADALGGIGDDAAVPGLLKAVFDHAGAYHAIMALGAMGSDSAVDALKKIIITNSNVKTEWGTDSSLSRQKEALITLWNLRGEQEKAFFCGLKADPALEPYKRALNMHCEDDSK